MNRLKKNIAKKIGYPLQDLLKGTRSIETLKFLKESKSWDIERINEYRLKKLKKLFKYSKENVPYYTKVFSKIKLNETDFNSVEDIIKIPILTKDIVRNNRPDLISKNLRKYRVKIGKTGGTTGVPLEVIKDCNNRSFTWGSYYRWYESMGLNYYDKVLTFWGSNTVLTQSYSNKIFTKIYSGLQNDIIVNSFKMSEADMRNITKLILKEKPLLIKGYLSAILKFGKYLRKNDINFDFVKAISTTTETLLPHNRLFIEKVFNAPVFNQYGCGEVSAISYECDHHNGLHINVEHVICEILDNNDKPIYNERGRIIATDLDNFVMPFLRFETGDISSIFSNPCSCGNNQPLMDSIDGRLIDTVVLKDGNEVHGVFFTDILYELNILNDNFPRFQILQNDPGKIEFRIESSNEFDVRLKSIIKSKFLNFLDDVKIVEMSSLPLNDNGKFAYIINNIK